MHSIELNLASFTEFPKLVGYEIGAQVGDDVIGKPKTMHDIHDEVNNPAG